MAERPQQTAANLALGHANSRLLLANLAHFARLLRKVGFAASGERCALAARALAQIGVGNRQDVRWALAACFVGEPAQLPVFEQAFALFWRSETAEAKGEASERAAAAGEQTLRRLAEQLSDARRRARARLQADSTGTASAGERLRQKDFEQMSDEEWRAAMRCIRELPAAMPPIKTRRRRPAATGGKPNMRQTLRAAMRQGGEAMQIKTAKIKTRPPALVALVDISASMSSYARMLAHFVAALAASRRQPARAFLFGTRLTPLRQNKSQDLDAQVAAIAAATPDWQGGTRIGDSLATFNRRWSRRVFAGGAVALLATDGLECGDLTALQAQLQRLKKSCRRLLWLNPLLRYDQYEALAGGARLLAKTASQTQAIHNLANLGELTAALGAPRPNRLKPPRRGAPKRQ